MQQKYITNNYKCVTVYNKSCKNVRNSPVQYYNIFTYLLIVIIFILFFTSYLVVFYGNYE